MIVSCLRPISAVTAVVVLMMSACTSPAADEPDGFKPIFNGKDLSGWSGDETFWRVENGSIVAESTPDKPCKTNQFLRWAADVDNFELKLEFRISGSESANSGIQFRSQVAPDGHVVGYQADIDLAGKWLGACYDEHGRGTLATRGMKTIVNSKDDMQRSSIGDADELLKAINLDGWNTYHITARGNEITLAINGKTTAKVIDEDKTDREFTGVLALQLHSGPPMKVEFRDIQLKRLPLENKKKIVFVAGSKSHGYFSHEHKAGCMLLADSLNKSGLPVITTVYTDGWPQDVTAFDNADTVVAYCDGGGRHFLNNHLEEFDNVMDKGVGLVCLHYAVETVKGPEGEHFLEWLGGYFEIDWSVNPHWTASFDNLPKHPITRGVQPFTINDEWYYHMRFREGMEGVTPILTDLPPRESLSRKDGHHSGNPYVREAVLVRKEPQHVGWAATRDNDGRSFGFTGGHFHQNWQNDNFRKVVLNAIAWTAHAEVPESGIESPTPTVEELQKNQDYEQPKNWKYNPPLGVSVSEKAIEKIISVKPVAYNAKTDPPQQSRELKDATAQLDIAEGLTAEVFAGEPLIGNPTNMDIDHLGRVWICEVVNYRNFRNTDSPIREEGDRILILTDTDGDGKADDVKTFYQGRDIDSAHGICVLGNKVIVSAGDSVFVLTDSNNDDKADYKETLFTGIDGTQHDHGIHAVVFGPDGKLYFNFGNSGKQIKDKDGQPIVDKQGNVVDSSRKPYQEGMVFRCNMDGSEFETLGWNFRNNWEVCVDSFGTMWQSDNDDDGNRGVRINYVMEFGNYGYKDELTGAGWRDPRTGWSDEIPLRHWHLNDPGTMPNLLQTGAGSPTGILCYEGNLLPEVFRDEIIHCDAGTNVVRSYPVEKDGAGYTATTVNILEGARDQWFRPSDVCVAPDGSLFVADWYDPGVGGHRMGDVERGRVFRVAPPEHHYKIAKIDTSSVEGAVKALWSPNQATRYQAWTRLQEAGPKAEAALVEMWNAEPARYRARALWALGKLGLGPAKTKEYIKAGLKDADPDIRITAIRLARQLADQIPPTEFIGVIGPDDKSPAVRREMLIAIRDLDLPNEPEFWADLAVQHDGDDRWYLEALGIAANGQWNECLNAWLARVGDNWRTKAGRDIIWRSRAEVTAKHLIALIDDPQTPAEELPRLFRSLDFAPQVPQEALAELAFTKRKSDARADLIASEAIARVRSLDLNARPDYRKSLNDLLAAKPESQTFISIVDRFKLEERYPDLIDIAVSHFDQQLGIDAVRTLLGNGQGKLLTKAMQERKPEEARKIAQAMGYTGENEAAKWLRQVLTAEDVDLSVRRAAAGSMGRTRPGTVAVMNFAKEGNVPNGLQQAIAAVLHASTYKDVKDVATELYPLPPSKDAEPLPPISELVKREGDVKNGRIVFHTNGTCAKCHQVNGQGKEVGPDLSEIGKKLSKQAMFESILYPSAGISHNYETYTAVTIDGEIVSGLLQSRTDDEISIKNAEGFVKTVPMDDVEELVKQEVSLMPADLQKVMSGQELVDVVDYMLTLKEKKK